MKILQREFRFLATLDTLVLHIMRLLLRCAHPFVVAYGKPSHYVRLSFS